MIDTKPNISDVGIYQRLYEAFRWVSFGDWDANPSRVEAHARIQLDPIISDIATSVRDQVIEQLALEAEVDTGDTFYVDGEGVVNEMVAAWLRSKKGGA